MWVFFPILFACYFAHLVKTRTALHAFPIFFRYTVPCDGASEHRDVKSPRRWVTLSCLSRITRITPNITSDKGKNGKDERFFYFLLLSHVGPLEFFNARLSRFFDSLILGWCTPTASLCVLFKSPVARTENTCTNLSFFRQKSVFYSVFLRFNLPVPRATCRSAVAFTLTIMISFYNTSVTSELREMSNEYLC